MAFLPFDPLTRRALLACTALSVLPAPARALPATAPLRLGVVARTVFELPLWAALQQGYFKQQGLDLTMDVFNGSDKISAELRSGALQVGIVPLEAVISDAYRGGSLRAVAGNAVRLPHFIIAQPEITSFAALKGKTIGVVSMNEGTRFFVADIERAGGLAPGDVRIEAVGGSPARQRLLNERKIDAAMQPFPFSYEAEEAGFSNLGPIAALVPDYLFTATVVDSAWAQAHRAQLVAFLRALRQGTEYIFAHPGETAALGASEIRSSVAHTRRALDETARMGVLNADLPLNPASLRRVFDTVKAAGGVDAAAVFDATRFTDPSFLADSRGP